MSRLTTLATIATEAKNNPALRHLNVNHVHLLAGAIGGYRNAVGNYTKSKKEWGNVDPKTKSKYTAAYGDKANEMYARKAAIRGAVTGAMNWYNGSKLVADLTHGGSPGREKKGKPLFSNRPGSIGLTHRERFSDWRGVAHDYVSTTNGRKAIGRYIRGAAVSKATDVALEHGPANLYGEVSKYVSKFANKRGSKSTSQSRKTHSSFNQGTRKTSRKTRI